MRIVRLFRIVCFVIVLVSLQSAALAETYRVGVVPQFEPRKLAAIWTPILQHLKSRTGHDFHLVGSPSIAAFEKAFKAGDYDFAYMNPYHAILASEAQGYVPLVRDGGRKLNGILVVHKNSPIQDLNALEGLEVAMPSPNALGASLLIRADLDMIYGVKIKPVYVQTHSSVYLNVALGQTPAGGGVKGTFNAQPETVRSQLRILYETRSMPPHPFTAHARVDPAVRQSVMNALLSMVQEEGTQALLSKVPFKELIAAQPSEYESLKGWGLDAYVSAPQQ